MASDKYSAGLTDQDEMSMFPSAASPLTALGIDPDEARANPELLERLNPAAATPPTATAKAAPAGPMTMPMNELDEDAAAKPAVASAPAAGRAPVPPSATDYGMAGLAGLKQNADMATQAVQDIPMTSPDVTRLAAERAKFSAAPALYSPQTGKMVSQTTEIDPATGEPMSIDPRPTKGTRVWRGVRGGLLGLMTSGIRGGLIGAIDPSLEGSQAYGAPNAAYQHAEEQRQGKVAATDAGLKTAFDNWKEQQSAAKARAGEFRANAGLGKDLTTGSTGMQNAATEALKAEDLHQNQLAETPEAKAKAKLSLTQQELDQRTAVADRMKLSPLNRTLYILNGRVPDPQEPNSAEIDAGQAAQGMVVYKAQHGGKAPESPEEYQTLSDIIAARAGKLSRGKRGEDTTDDEVGSIVASATQKKQEYADQWVRQPDGSYATPDFTKRITGKDFMNKIEQFRTDANVKLAKKGSRIDEQGNLVQTGSSKRAPATTGAADPQTHVFDAAAWAAANPQGDVEAAKAKARKLNFTVR